jgi:hypothetical protein
MSERNRWERLIGLMEQQKELLDSFTEASADMRTGLHSRDWPALETALKTLDALADRLEDVENKRSAAAAELTGSDVNLEKKISNLDPETRARFHTARGELKARLVTVRSRLRGVSGYAAARGRLGRELMEELVPSTRGRMYDKRGRSASAGRDPLVVSHHL